MDQSRFIAQHVVNLPKSGIRDFFDIVTKMTDAISLGGVLSKPVAASRHLH
jgi:aminotransferase